MVYPVQMVSPTAKTKRERGRSGQDRSGSRNESFRHLLDQAAGGESLNECYVVTYNADKQLNTFHYLSREYTF